MVSGSAIGAGIGFISCLAGNQEYDSKLARFEGATVLHGEQVELEFKPSLISLDGKVQCHVIHSAVADEKHLDVRLNREQKLVIFVAQAKAQCWQWR